MEFINVNNVLLAVVAFFSAQTYYELKQLSKTTINHSVRLGKLETRCDDTHGDSGRHRRSSD